MKLFKRKGSQCPMRYWLVMLCCFISTSLSGCACARKEVIYVGDSRRIAILEIGESAPFRGILITQGYFEYLLDLEGAAQ